jgi:hypothetical protein
MLEDEQLKRIKNRVASLIYSTLGNTKMHYFKIASEINLMTVPQTEPGSMSSVSKYIDKILNAFSYEEDLKFISEVVRRNYKGLDVYKPYPDYFEKAEKNHRELIKKLNDVFIYLDLTIENDGEIKNKNISKEKSYGQQECYDFYKDLNKILKQSVSEVFIVDAYMDEKTLELYVDNIAPGIKIRMLTYQMKGNFLTVAKYFSKKPGVVFEVRQNTDKTIHDRIIFVDNDDWHAGTSIKDAAIKQPTSLVKLTDIGTITKERTIYEDLWNKATPISL